MRKSSMMIQRHTTDRIKVFAIYAGFAFNRCIHKGIFKIGLLLND